MMCIDGSVKKTIIYPGKGMPHEFKKSTKAVFHFQSRTLTENGELGPILDDSRELSRPMVMYFGKQFKMPVWEECLKSMLVGEIATFRVHRSLVSSYPLISHSFRQYARAPNDHRRYCCGMASAPNLWEENDINAIMQEPKDMLFTMELLKVECSGEYEEEPWMMSAEEKLSSIPRLKEEGNKLYNEKHFKEASCVYAEALNRLEQLILREVPGDVGYHELEKAKVPFLLNYAQCKLQEKDFYTVIKYASEVLQQDPSNVKALYKRAKAHAAVWNLQSAEDDFRNILKIDQSLMNLVLRELANIAAKHKQKDAEDRKKYFGKICSKKS